jgi:hypothetical protein
MSGKYIKLESLENTRTGVLGFGTAILVLSLVILGLAIGILVWVKYASADPLCADDNPCTLDVRTAVGCEHHYAGLDSVCEDVCLVDAAGTCAYSNGAPFCNGTCVGLCPNDNATLDCPELDYNTTSYLTSPSCLYGQCAYVGMVGLDLQILLVKALTGEFAVNETISATGDIETAKAICMNIINRWEPRYNCLNVLPLLLAEEPPLAICLFGYKCALDEFVSEGYIPNLGSRPALNKFARDAIDNAPIQFRRSPK